MRRWLALCHATCSTARRDGPVRQRVAALSVGVQIRRRRLRARARAYRRAEVRFRRSTQRSADSRGAQPKAFWWPGHWISTAVLWGAPILASRGVSPGRAARPKWFRRRSSRDADCVLGRQRPLEIRQTLRLGTGKRRGPPIAGVRGLGGPANAAFRDFPYGFQLIPGAYVDLVAPVSAPGGVRFDRRPRRGGSLPSPRRHHADRDDRNGGAGRCARPASAALRRVLEVATSLVRPAHRSQGAAAAVACPGVAAASRADRAARSGRRA